MGLARAAGVAGARARLLFKDINAIVVHSLKAVQGG